MTSVRFKIDLAKPRRELKPKAPKVAREVTQPSRAARRLALAYWIERKIEAGELQDYAHAARILSVTRARVTQVANMLLLPIETQEGLLTCSRASRR